MLHKITSTNREQWLQSRQGGIGSSEVGTILGLNEYESAYQLWRRKMGYDAPKQENRAMMMGHILEPAVAQCWELETGGKIVKNSAKEYVVYRDEAPWRRVSPDREYKTYGKGRGILECKTTAMKVDVDNIPQVWYLQLQYQLGVCGYSEGTLAWLINGREFDCKRFEFNPSIFAIICDKVDEFWYKNVGQGIAPPAVTDEDLKVLFPKHIEGKCAEADLDTMDAICQLKMLKDNRKKMDEEIARLELIVKKAMEDAENLVYGDRIVATYRASANAYKVDTNALKTAYPSLVAQYTHEVAGSRRFLIK